MSAFVFDYSIRLQRGVFLIDKIRESHDWYRKCQTYMEWWHTVDISDLWITVTTRETLNYKFNPIPLSAELDKMTIRQGYKYQENLHIKISWDKYIYMRPRYREILSAYFRVFLSRTRQPIKRKRIRRLFRPYDITDFYTRLALYLIYMSSSIPSHIRK